MNKIKNKAGETLVEVLVSILIVTFTFILLTNSMTSAARVTDQAKKMDTGFQYSTETSADTKKLKIVFSDSDIKSTETDIDIYQAETGEYYYKSHVEEGES